MLLERPGGLVTRDELRERLWSDDTFVDFEHGVTTAVKKLRQTLNDSAAKPRYVETLPKRGYRFIADVEFEEHEPVAAPTPASSAPAETAPAPAPAIAIEPAPVPETPPAPSKPRLRDSSAIRAAAAAVVGLTFASLFAFSGPEPSDLDPGPVRRLAFIPDSLSPLAPGATISPDGRHVAFVGAGPEFKLWIQDLAEEEPIAVAGSQGASRPFWSPDNRHIAFVSDGRLLRVSPHGGAPIEVCRMPAGNYAGGSWSPSGERIVFSAGRPPRLFSVAVAGGEPEPLFDPVAVDEQSGDGNRDPAFLVNDDRPELLAFAVGRPSKRTLFVRDLETGEQRMLDRGQQPAYATSGHLLYERGGDVWAARFSVRNLALEGEARLVATGALRPSVSAAGTLVYSDDPAADSQRRLGWRDRMGNRLGAVGAPREGPTYFALSPDESTAAVLSYGDRRVPAALLDLQSGQERTVDLGPAGSAYLVWSPDSRSLVWREDRGRRTALRTGAETAEGAALEGVRTPLPDVKDVSDWAGSTLLFSRGDDLWTGRQTPDGQWQVQPLLERPGQQVSARLSPDGRRFAYSSDETGRFEVYLAELDAPHQSVRISRDGGVQPAWSLDGRELFFVSRGRLMATAIPEDRRTAPAPAQILFADRMLFSPNKARYVYAPASGDRFLMMEYADPSRPPSIRLVDNWVRAYWPTTP